MKKNNILLVGLDYNFTKRVGEEFALLHNLYPLDTNDLSEYSLLNSQKMKDICGMEYFEREQKKVILSIADYENVVVNFPYSLLLNDEYFGVLNNFSIVFIDLDKKVLEGFNKLKSDDNNLDVELLAFEELREVLVNRCEFTVCTGGKIEDCIKKLNKLNIV